jgi:hypothetical protein
LGATTNGDADYSDDGAYDQAEEEQNNAANDGDEEENDGNEERRRWLDEQDDPNNGLFQCDDDAGYTNVNQCMKFATKTNMIVATFSDMTKASQQGGIMPANVPGVAVSQFEATREKYGFLIFAVCFFVFNAFFFCWARRRAMRSNSPMVRPLIKKK